MEIYKLRDVVRENVGRDRLADHMLTWVVERGLREVEKTGNWYWMEAKKEFVCVADQRAYSMYTSSSGGLNIPAYKDTIQLYASDQTLTNPTWSEVFGPDQLSYVKTRIQENELGIPVVWTKEESATDVTMNLWPLPDSDYSLELHYYQWTSLPAASTSEAHEVLKRWPEALIYLACEQAFQAVAKDVQAATYWRGLFEQSEFPKLNRYHNDRTQSAKGEFRARTGPYGRTLQVGSSNRGYWR